MLAGRNVPIEKTLLTGNTCAHLLYDLYLVLMAKFYLHCAFLWPLAMVEMPVKIDLNINEFVKTR